MNSQVDASVFQPVIQHIVQSVHPKRVILFGSTARGASGIHSDLDLLVVMPNDADCGKLMGELYVHTMDLPYTFDFVVTTEERLSQFKDQPGLIYRQVLDEGIELYAA